MIYLLNIIFIVAIIAEKELYTIENAKLLFYGIGPTIETFQSNEVYQDLLNDSQYASYCLDGTEYGWTCVAYPFIEITRFFNPWGLVGNTSTSKGRGKEQRTTIDQNTCINSEIKCAESNSNTFYYEIGNGFQLYVNKYDDKEFIWYLFVGYNHETGKSYTRIADQTYYTQFKGKGFNAGLALWYSCEHSWSMFTGIDIIPNPFVIKTQNLALSSTDTNCTKTNLVEIALYSSFYKEIQKHYHIGIGLFITGYKSNKPSPVQLNIIDQQAYKNGTLKLLKGAVFGILLNFRQDF